MIIIETVLKQHSLVIAQSGGADGIRDRNILESAIGRPFQTFAGQDLYPTVLGKAAAILESIIVNHPFVDGNKRTGYTVARTFLRINGFDINAAEDNRYDFIIAIASGEMHYEDILNWLQQNTQKI